MRLMGVPSKADAGKKFPSSDVLNTKKRTNNEVLCSRRLKMERCELFQLFVCQSGVARGGILKESSFEQKYL